MAGTTAAPLLRLALGVVDLERRRVQVGDEERRLTTIEAKLLGFLASRPGEAVGRDTLLREVWGYADGVVSRTVDVAIRRLRAKIERDRDDPEHLLAVHGVGYAFVPLPEPLPALPEDEADPLVGREVELARAWAALEAGGAPLTLTGPAGVGKTRLAEALARVARSRGWRAALVEAGAARDGDDLGSAVASALGAKTSADAVIHDALGADPALLVLDELEALPAEALARLSAWRRPGLRLLLTSRRALGLPGEQLLALAPLPLLDALALLRIRARRARPDVRLDEETARALVERLDGLPLALELAAARLRALSAAELRERINLPFLRDPSPRRPRHATLGAALDASWALLDPEARRALVLLAALPAPGAVAVAERTLERAGLVDPLLILERLCDLSLAQVREGPELAQLARLSLLSCVREHAATRQAAEGAPEGLEIWAEALAETLEGWLPRGSAEPRGIARVIGETEGVRALLLRHAGRAPEAALRAVEVWLNAARATFGHPSEEALARAAVALAEAQGAREAQARLMVRLVFALDRVGAAEEARAAFERLAALARQDPGLGPQVTHAGLGLVSALRRSERPRDALALLEALDLHEAPPRILAHAEAERGLILLRLGFAAEAAEALASARRGFLEAGERQSAELQRDHLFVAAVELGQGAAVEAEIREVIALQPDGPDGIRGRNLRGALCAIALEAGRLEEAREGFERAVSWGEEQRRPLLAILGRSNLGLVALARGDAAEARAAFEEATAAWLRHGGERISGALVAGATLAAAGLGLSGVEVDLSGRALVDAPLDEAQLRLARAVAARARGEPEAEAAVDAALADPMARTSLVLRVLGAFVRAMRAGSLSPARAPPPRPGSDPRA